MFVYMWLSELQREWHLFCVGHNFASYFATWVKSEVKIDRYPVLPNPLCGLMDWRSAVRARVRGDQMFERPAHCTSTGMFTGVNSPSAGRWAFWRRGVSPSPPVCNVENFKYLEGELTDQSSTHETCSRRLNTKTAANHVAQKLLSSRFLSGKIKCKIH